MVVGAFGRLVDVFNEIDLRMKIESGTGINMSSFLGDLLRLCSGGYRPSSATSPGAQWSSVLKTPGTTFASRSFRIPTTHHLDLGQNRTVQTTNLIQLTVSKP